MLNKWDYTLYTSISTHRAGSLDRVLALWAVLWRVDEGSTLLNAVRMAKGSCHQWCLRRIYREDLKELTCQRLEAEKSISVSGTSSYRSKKISKRRKSKNFYVIRVQEVMRKDTGNLRSRGHGRGGFTGRVWEYVFTSAVPNLQIPRHGQHDIWPCPFSNCIL